MCTENLIHIGPCESLCGVMFGLPLTAHGQLGICLACAFQDGWPFCHCFVSAQDDLYVERIKLEATAASAGLFASDECRSRTEEWVDDDVATFGQVEQRVFQHGNRLDGGVFLQPVPSENSIRLDSQRKAKSSHH